MTGVVAVCVTVTVSEPSHSGSRASSAAVLLPQPPMSRVIDTQAAMLMIKRFTFSSALSPDNRSRRRGVTFRCGTSRRYLATRTEIKEL